MQSAATFTTFLVTLIGPVVCFVVLLLILKFAARLKTLTAVCLAGLLAGLAATMLTSLLNTGRVKSWLLLLLLLLPAVVCAGILIAQFLVWLFSKVSPDSGVSTPERRRILQMLEEGKITAQEGSELLDAMGRSSALRGAEKFTRLDLAMLAGVSLVVLGFFLPWARVGITVHNQSAMFSSVDAYQAGYHTGALGWAVFIIGIISAIPIFITPKNLLYKISMLQIFLTLVGLVLVISILARVSGHSLPGLIFCLAGFLVELLASAAKLKKLAA
jgi:hypothetical protein